MIEALTSATTPSTTVIVPSDIEFLAPLPPSAPTTIITPTTIPPKNHFLQFKKNKIREFCTLYGVEDHKKLVKDDHLYFRYTCFKYLDFLRTVSLPPLQMGLDKEAVLIEFRNFPHVEFLLRNCILKLGNAWSYTVVCGSNNYEMVKAMCPPNVKILKMAYDNLTPSQYNQLLTTVFFWNLFVGEKILLYQEDSIIFRSNIDDFLAYDFVGAPFPKSQDDTPNAVGNGGLSLRSRSKMLRVIQTISVKNTKFNASTLKYMKRNDLTVPPEDIYFSKNMQELHLGRVADYETAGLFSTESIYNRSSFGGHKFWISNRDWRRQMKDAFPCLPYTPRSDIGMFLKYRGLSPQLSRVDTIKNAFDVDTLFTEQANRLKCDSDSDDVIHFCSKIALHGYLYHPKQITNIFPEAKLMTFLGNRNITVMHENIVYRVDDFARRFLYDVTFDEIKKTMITNLYYRMDSTKAPLLILAFIGNIDRGLDLIERIIQYKKIQAFNVAFCFNVNCDLTEELRDLIKSNFDEYAIYESKEFGTDITPTMLMYDHIVSTESEQKREGFDHLIKLQTKSITKPYIELTNYLLTKRVTKLTHLRRPDCLCVGHPKYYIRLHEDKYNNELKLSYIQYIHSHFSFVGGTIFFCDAVHFDKTLAIMKRDFKMYLYNNLYENNCINQDFSPIHFLERLFGVIK